MVENILSILYEDNHCIAVIKPHGMLAQADRNKEQCLLEEVKTFIKKRDKKPGRVFLGLVHRLDRPVGGIMLFAKTSKGASRLSEAIRSHLLDKTYLAVLEGIPQKQEGIVEQWLLKNQEKNKVTIVPEGTIGAKAAFLRYHVLKTNKDRTLVNIVLKTGRSHQIRVAMQSLGCPIVGDKKYGSSVSLNGDIALFAQTLVFPHPITKQKISLKADPVLRIFYIF